MGSSPVTATTSSPSPVERLVEVLAARLREESPLTSGDLLLVGFSGGADSTALLLGLQRLAPQLGWRLVAGHVDHHLDPGSAARARAAARLAHHLSVPFRLLEASLDATPARRGESREAAARSLRYTLLEGLRQELGARYLLTAHHADDQAETVLLRLAQGSGLAGLAGIAPRRGALLRPLLSLTRAELAAAVACAGLHPIEDPTNQDLAVPRNRLRHLLLPALGGAGTAARARSVGGAAASVATGLERRLLTSMPELACPSSPRLRLAALRELPAELVPWTLAILHRRSGATYPPRAVAVAELRRQVARVAAVAIDCGGGWRWESDEAGLLRALSPESPRREEAGRTTAGAPTPPFAYTVSGPGGVEIREAATTFRLSRQPVADWMRRGSPGRAALDLPLAPGSCATVRSRRPGDRLQPFGTHHTRRLKDLLIDHKVPRERRDRVPLLCVGDQVAWVPGITIHHPFRLREGASIAWVAELTPHGG